MKNEMVEEVIAGLLGKVTVCTTSGDALKYTQAVLNIAHAYATIEGAKKLN